ncbi:MAG: TPM domain-containing protein [Chloroflexota bacterium]
MSPSRHPALRTIRLAAAAATALLLLTAIIGATAAAAGPPFPDPVTGQRVYDTAGILSPSAIAEAERISRAIEDRTGAQVVVYTQLKPESDTPDAAEDDAIALMDQWGIGRKGFDDGLVILFDMDESLRHGQVQLYAGPGFRTAFLSNEEKQAIYENDMLPLLRGADMDGAVLAALAKVDQAATVDHAQTLERGRIVNAIVGLLLGPGLFLLLVGWTVFHWLRYGRDPVFVDDPSVLMSAPPAELTAASGALVHDGSSSRRALTTALLDLASRGELAFEQEDGLLSKKVSLRTEGRVPATEEEAARRRLNARKPLSAAESYALRELRDLSDGGHVLADEELLKFGTKVSTFNDKLEAFAVERGWFGEAPAKVTRGWRGRGVLELVGGFIASFVGFQIPFSGLVVLGVGLVAAGIVTVVLARAMPARTMAGATIRAMLAAYRRTLDKTMAQARSMDQVVDEAKLDWIETPDQAMVWAVALGLQHQAETVLERSAADLRQGSTTSTPWFPAWYGTSASFVGGGIGSDGGSVFSASAVPDFGGMFGALGAVGNSPSSSGSGGGGGFGGGGSGGGGGGSGGGF